MDRAGRADDLEVQLAVGNRPRLQPALELDRPDGTPVNGVEVVRWRTGQIDLVALFGRVKGQARVRLPAPRFVYDLRRRRALGQTREAFERV